MKTLTKYLNEKLVVNQRFDEKLIINKDYKDVHAYTCSPKTFDELRNIIEDRYDKLGPGTKTKPINFNDVDVSNIDSFSNENNKGIFAETKFEYINISDWNVSKVKYMNHMFYYCKQLKSVGDLSDWDVSDVEDMRNMFFKCEHLQSVGDLYDWNVSKVKYMNHMFYYCKQLKSVGDLSNWDVSDVEDIACMFYNCKQLTSVGDLSNWNILHVKYMSAVFYRSGITNIPSWHKK